MHLEFIDILSNEECNFFLDAIKGMRVGSIYGKDGSTTFYNRYKVISQNIQNRLEQFLFQKFNTSYYLVNNHFWINEVTPLTNKNDVYHLDDCQLTIITYLNDDFNGGEFEYLDNNIPKKILPIKNKSIILSGHINHRTLPITSGIRHSLVGAFNVPVKNAFSLL